MFPRVTNPSAAPVPTEVVRALDLHVLGVPPAFVLSQDQTLKLKPRIKSGVSLTFEPLHIAPLFKRDSFLFVVLQVFIRKQETVQTVKLTLHHRAGPRSGASKSTCKC